MPVQPVRLFASTMAGMRSLLLPGGRGSGGLDTNHPDTSRRSQRRHLIGDSARAARAQGYSLISRRASHSLDEARMRLSTIGDEEQFGPIRRRPPGYGSFATARARRFVSSPWREGRQGGRADDTSARDKTEASSAKGAGSIATTRGPVGCLKTAGGRGRMTRVFRLSRSPARGSAGPPTRLNRWSSSR